LLWDGRQLACDLITALYYFKFATCHGVAEAQYHNGAASKVPWAFPSVWAKKPALFAGWLSDAKRISMPGEKKVDFFFVQLSRLMNPAW
jgi:hypothetical protein